MNRIRASTAPFRMELQQKLRHGRRYGNGSAPQGCFRLDCELNPSRVGTRLAIARSGETRTVRENARLQQSMLLARSGDSQRRRKTRRSDANRARTHEFQTRTMSTRVRVAMRCSLMSMSSRLSPGIISSSCAGASREIENQTPSLFETRRTKGSQEHRRQRDIREMFRTVSGWIERRA